MRHWNQLCIGLLLAVLALLNGWPPGLAQPTVTLQQQVDAYAAQGRGSQGVAALLITPEGSETAFAGETGNPAHPAPSADTLFEIGSITKVFTALLLANQVNQGAVALDTTVEALVPGTASGHSISLQALASHTAGLPRLPVPRALWGILYPANPYRGSRTAELYRALGAAAPSEPGICQYSNLGPALLGQLLANAAGDTYENLVQTQVLTPLGLTDTYLDLPPAAKERLAQGHRENALPTANWQFDAYAPAGALKSTLTDMGRFLTAAMAADWPPLALSLQIPDTDCQPNVGLGWIFTALGDAPMVMHNGRTGGYYAFLGWLPEAGRGLVLLTNTSDDLGDRIATALLAGEPLPTRDFPLGSLLVMAVLGGMLLFQSWQLARPPRSRDRLKQVQTAAETVLLLALSYQLGPWHWLPVTLWWSLLALVVGLLLRRLRQRPAGPPAESAPRRSRTRYLSLASTLLVLGWAILCLR
ncbi:serine hydrolase domain-containing protein [Leptolyngbya sp. KIOST-1]|uniref:serine hydrolase domain-containing protein n=1 Tax=Leptolyngbya sp. KIOST-1 TaxID=1229172 RepID=UPI0006922B45|nr:serine hydrolase domain-containing protein [Leptolyngbya sp. KIOST-1]